MKRLPIYGLLLTGYTIIIIGVIKLYNDLKIIEVINIPETQETRLDIVPAIIISVFVLIITVSIGVWAITELWKYLVAHKTLLPLPFLLIALGFLNLTVRVMEGIKVMINSNAQVFTENLSKYISAFSTLGTYTLVGIIVICLSVVYSVLLKRGIIFA